MNLTLRDMAELPLAAAAMDADGTVIAQTPEWTAAGPGTVAYPVRRNRLLVATSEPRREAQLLLDRLLEGMATAAVATGGIQKRRLSMLAASLRLVVGRDDPSVGTSHDAIETARAGIAVRTGLDVAVEGALPWPVRAPEVVALVLVQLASNAERHTGVTRVTLRHHDPGILELVWPGRSGRPSVRASRTHGARERWGLGFARIAADTLGGVVFPPRDRPDGTVAATFELGLRRLALPLAAVRSSRVIRGTRGWDEETGLPPGREVPAGSPAAGILAAALATPRRLLVGDVFSARSVDGHVWLAVPPDGIVDRAADVLDGIAHERALWDGTPEPHRSRVFALASLLGALLGRPLPRVPAGAWNRRSGELWPALGLPCEAPEVTAVGALDPRLVAYAASQFGAGFEGTGDQLWLRIRRNRLLDPAVQVLAPRGGRVAVT